ncbi:hypothetical protein D3C72_1432420 [compost metagenome]
MHARALLAENHVQLAARLQTQQVGGDTHLQFDRRIRMRPMKGLQHLRQPGAREVFGRPDPQAAFQPRAAQPGARFAFQIDDVAGVGVQRLAGGRELEAACGARKQRGACQQFQTLDVAADR